MSDIDFESYVESQIDRADFMRKSLREDETIERQAEMWNGLSTVEKLEYIDRTRSEFRKYNCECGLDDSGTPKYKLICYQCSFVRKVKKENPELLEKYSWVRPESDFLV
jgi:hypothetical protein